jgi:hypothetical protein
MIYQATWRVDDIVLQSLVPSSVVHISLHFRRSEDTPRPSVLFADATTNEFLTSHPRRSTQGKEASDDARYTGSSRILTEPVTGITSAGHSWANSRRSQRKVPKRSEEPLQHALVRFSSQRSYSSIDRLINLALSSSLLQLPSDHNSSPSSVHRSDRASDRGASDWGIRSIESLSDFEYWCFHNCTRLHTVINLIRNHEAS